MSHMAKNPKQTPKTDPPPVQYSPTPIDNLSVDDALTDLAEEAILSFRGVVDDEADQNGS